MELSASHQTEGIYLCYKEGTDVLLLAHVICLKEEEKGEIDDVDCPVQLDLA